MSLGEVIRCGNEDGAQLAKLVNNKRMYQRALSVDTVAQRLRCFQGSFLNIQAVAFSHVILEIR